MVTRNGLGCDLIEDEPVTEKTRQLKTKHVFVSPFLTPLLLFP